MLEDSPSLDDYSKGIPPTRPDPPNARKLVRIAILLLSLVALAMGLIRFFQSDIPAQMAGTGEIAGSVVGDYSQPLGAEIYILGTQIVGKADVQGNFLITGVPSGQQSIAILHRGSGLEYPVFVQPGQTINLGEIKLIATTEPSE